MDIRTKNTGRAFYQIQPDLASVLLELGLVERIEKPVAQPAKIEPQWAVTVNQGGGTCIALTIGATTSWSDGDPADAPKAFQRKDWTGKLTGHATPKEIVQRYEARLTPQDCERIRAMNHFSKGKK